KSPDNAGAPDWSSKQLMLHYYDDGSWNKPELAILINMETSAEVQFTLPAGRTWYRVVDTQAWFDTDAYFAAEPTADEYTSQNIDPDDPLLIGEATYGVPARTIVIMESPPAS
ncbi:MAG: glycosyl hydrolase, partial [Deltaproteobacteria bacterium]|nr:glycosyl hydrolase [Deltaproteobacteria bacterium]